MAIKKSLNNPNKPAPKNKLVKLPAKMGGSTTSLNPRTGTAKYPGKKGFAVATGVTKKGLKSGGDEKGKMFGSNMSSKVEDRTVFKTTAKGAKLAANKAARAAKKA
jgi:hypothetical protein